MGFGIVHEVDSSFSKVSIEGFFVKHELKGVLNCIGVEIWTHPPVTPHRP